MSEIEARFAALEARIAGLEDQLAIYQLIATYGPSVDSRTGSVTTSLWAEDGVYDFGVDPLVGAEKVGSLVNIEPHIHYVADGCAHVLSMPYVTVDGDTAVATGYSRVYLNQGDHWRVERASANRWELVRTPEGWRVRNRINRLLNGQPEARELLSNGVKGEA